MSSQPHELEQINDAWLTSDFDPDFLSRDITIAVAGTVRSRTFKNVTATVGDFLHRLSRHEEGTKDGLIMVPGSLKETRRRASEVSALALMLFDIDTGQKFDDVNRALFERGLAYFMYSSFSSNKSTTICLHDHLIHEMSLNCDAVITTELVKRYLAEVKSYASEVVNSVSGFEIVSVDNTLKIHIIHAPMDKFRVGLFLERLFIPDEHGHVRSAQAYWTGSSLAVAKSLGLNHDHACHDLPHGYYFPRHPRGAPFKIRMGGGRMLDLGQFTPLPVAARAVPMARNTFQTKPTVVAGASNDIRARIQRKLSWIGGDLDLVDLIAKRIGWETRGNPTEIKASILCPNDDAHSNPGDPMDTGCVVMNPEAAREKRSIITCRHEHCRHLRTADFLSMMFAQIEIEGAGQ